MTNYEDSKDAERKLEKSKLAVAASVKQGVNDLHNIKENIVDLAHNIKDASTESSHQAADYLRHQAQDLKVSGNAALARIETHIKEKPGQSIAIAFTAGLLAKYLLGRRAA